MDADNEDVAEVGYLVAYTERKCLSLSGRSKRGDCNATPPCLSLSERPSGPNRTETTGNERCRLMPLVVFGSQVWRLYVSALIQDCPAEVQDAWRAFQLCAAGTDSSSSESAAELSGPIRCESTEAGRTWARVRDSASCEAAVYLRENRRISETCFTAREESLCSSSPECMWKMPLPTPPGIDVPPSQRPFQGACVIKDTVFHKMNADLLGGTAAYAAHVMGADAVGFCAQFDGASTSCSSRCMPPAVLQEAVV